MMFQVGDDGVVSSVNEDDLIYVDKNELEQFVESYHKLEKENEQLKNEIEKIAYANEDLLKEKRLWKKLSDEYAKLYEDNEQLKRVIKEVSELLSDEVDIFSEKATEHDIIAYVELKELDNKDAYYMATATKKAIQMLKELQK